MLGGAALAGCPDEGEVAPVQDAGSDVAADTSSVCPAGYLGDRAKDPIIELRALRADGTDVPIADGADLAVLFPPQGGRVAFVGVRATNLDGCGVQVTGALMSYVSEEVSSSERFKKNTQDCCARILGVSR